MNCVVLISLICIAYYMYQQGYHKGYLDALSDADRIVTDIVERALNER